MSLSNIKKVPGRFFNRILRRQGSKNNRKGQPKHIENDGQFGSEQPLLTRRDEEELIKLLKENISMDFILEMKEAFQLFDKVNENLK